MGFNKFSRFFTIVKIFINIVARTSNLVHLISYCYKSFCKFHFNIIHPSKCGVSLLVSFLQALGIKFVWIDHSSNGFWVSSPSYHPSLRHVTNNWRRADLWIVVQCFDQENFLRCSIKIRHEPSILSTRTNILRHGRGAVRRRTDSARAS